MPTKATNQARSSIEADQWRRAYNEEAKRQEEFYKFKYVKWDALPKVIMARARPKGRQHAQELLKTELA
eukprot:IDg13532t1